MGEKIIFKYKCFSTITQNLKLLVHVQADFRE